MTFLTRTFHFRTFLTPRGWISRHLAPAASLAFLLLVAQGCTSGAVSSPEKPKSSTTAVSLSQPQQTPEPGTDLIETCPGLSAETEGTIDHPEIDEASGLLASQQTEGDDPILWIHNDSGTKPSLFATSTTGRSLGRFEINESTSGISSEMLESTDVEDIASSAGTILLGDIGDNDAERDFVRIFSFPEPKVQSTNAELVTIPTATVTTLNYPDGAQDAEALLVDPIDNALIIFTKNIGLNVADGPAIGPTTAGVYAVPLEQLGASSPVTMTKVATIEVSDLSAKAQQQAADGKAKKLGLGGLITAADISMDGRRIGVRTYESVWVFSRNQDQTLAEALAVPACEAPVIPETQGEAFAFMPNGSDEIDFVTVSEGEGAAIHRTRHR